MSLHLSWWCRALVISPANQPLYPSPLGSLMLVFQTKIGTQPTSIKQILTYWPDSEIFICRISYRYSYSKWIDWIRTLCMNICQSNRIITNSVNRKSGYSHLFQFLWPLHWDWSPAIHMWLLNHQTISCSKWNCVVWTNGITSPKRWRTFYIYNIRNLKDAVISRYIYIIATYWTIATIQKKK